MTLYKKVNNKDVELTVEEVEIYEAAQPKDADKLIIAKEHKITLCRDYLVSTDWYSHREIDQQNSFPQSIKDKRILIRKTIGNIESCLTIEELDLINIDLT